jgi:hypothetical protein
MVEAARRFVELAVAEAARQGELTGPDVPEAIPVRLELLSALAIALGADDGISGLLERRATAMH